MNVVLIIPTGLGAEIGGHAGDATPVAKLIGKCCNTLITHPNVVNASDHNEMPDNTLYVEGSILDRFLRGEIRLNPVKTYNRILLIVNRPVTNETINAVSTARMTLGADIKILELKEPLIMKAFFKGGRATGHVSGIDSLIDQVNGYYDCFDAIALSTSIDVDNKETALEYLRGVGGINPWGGVEAKVSKRIADATDKPVAHAPFGHTIDENFNEVVDPRMAAEMVSCTYLQCVLKGLHRAPRISKNVGLSVNDVDLLISPVCSVGEPHWACEKAGIPIIVVNENRAVGYEEMYEKLSSNEGNYIVVENYLEAAGLIMAMKAGVYWRILFRPVKQTERCI